MGRSKQIRIPEHSIYFVTECKNIEHIKQILGNEKFSKIVAEIQPLTLTLGAETRVKTNPELYDPKQDYI